MEARLVMSATPASGDFADNVSPNPPFVAKDPSGNTVEAWAAASYDGNGNQISSGDVYFNLYNPSGQLVASRDVANNSSSNSSGVAALGMNSAGQFVILWTNTDGSGKKYERFSSTTGAAVGSLHAFATTGAKPYFEIGIDNNDNVVVLSCAPPKSSGIANYLQKFNSSDVQVASWNLTPDGQYSSLSMDTQTGAFAVAWTAGDIDGDPQAIDAEVFSSTNQAGGIITVAPTPAQGSLGVDSVAMNDSGNFVVAWGYDDGNGTETVQAQQYNINGVKIGGTQTLASISTSNGTIGNESVAINDNGLCVVTWSYKASSSNSWVIYAEAFTSTATRAAAAVASNTSNATYVDHHIAMDSNGNVTIVYSAGSPPNYIPPHNEPSTGNSDYAVSFTVS